MTERTSNHTQPNRASGDEGKLPQPAVGPLHTQAVLASPGRPDSGTPPAHVELAALRQAPSPESISFVHALDQARYLTWYHGQRAVAIAMSEGRL